MSNCNSELFGMTNNKLVNFKDKHGDSPLHRAVNDPNCTSRSVRKHLKKPFINSRNFLGHTPLHCAIINNCHKMNVIQLLIRQGADVNAEDCNGSTALHKAVQNPKCSVKLIDFLIKNDAYLVLKQYRHETPLMSAVRCYNPNLEIIKKLMFIGCIDVCAMHTENHNTLRILCSNLVIIKLLLQYSAYIGPNSSGNDYSEYENILVFHCLDSVCGFKSLLERNSDGTDLATSLLMYAVKYPSFNMEVIKELLKKGACIYSKDCRFRNAMYYALRNPQCSLELIRELLKYEPPGRLWYLLDYESNSYLHIAAANRNCPVEVIKEVLEKDKGVYLNSGNTYHLTPLECAADFTQNTCCNLDIVEAILMKGGSTIDMTVLWKNIQVLGSRYANRDVLDCTKLLVKYALVEVMRSVHEAYSCFTKMCARFRRNDKCGYFAELVSHLNACYTEIMKMIDIEFCFRGGINVKVVNQKMFTFLVSNQFPLYRKFILSLMDKNCLADSVSGVLLFTANEKGCTACLNSHCIHYLVLYMQNEDAFNLYLAFKDENDAKFITNSADMQIKWIEHLGEAKAEPFENSCSIVPPKKKYRLY